MDEYSENVTLEQRAVERMKKKKKQCSYPINGNWRSGPEHAC